MNEEKKQIVIDQLLQGRKIEAIKTLREEEGIGLKEAKEVIDELQKTMADNPEMKEKMKSAKGCGAALLLMGILSLFSISLLAIVL